MVSAKQFGHCRGKGWLRPAAAVALCWSFGAGMTVAEIQAGTKINVVCSGSDQVAETALAGLCADLRATLKAKYPQSIFDAADAESDADGRITLETFTAGYGELSARLVWQARGADPVAGLKQGLSVSDAEMTPAMQLMFLKRLVQETDLPI